MPRSVLVVEDDKDLCEIFVELFEYAGMHVEYAVDGQQALDLLAHFIPDMITLDIHLPRVSGLEVLQRIHADDRFANTMVTVITADTLLAESLEGQADTVLIKPIEFNQITALLN